MVLPTSLVTPPGFSKYRIGTTNSKILRSLGSMQSLMACPSLGLMVVWNLSSTHLSVLPALFHPSFRKLYTVAQTSAVDCSGSRQIVPSYSFERFCKNSCAIASLRRVHDSAKSPSHPIKVKSSTNCSFSFLFFGTSGIIDVRLTEGSSTLTARATAIAKKCTTELSGTLLTGMLTRLPNVCWLQQSNCC